MTINNVFAVQWNPDREDHLLLKQSAILLSQYYQIQMAVHRPFISTRRQSPLTFPSLIICTNAARSAVRVVSALYQKTGDPSYKNVVSPASYSKIDIVRLNWRCCDSRHCS